MSLRHALLGLLAQGPASGYDLTRAFDGGIGRYAWQAGHSRIYPELGKMTEAGQVVVDETVLRMFLVQSLEPDDARKLLEGIAAHCAAEIEELRPVMEAEDAEHREGDPLPFGRLAGEYGLRQYEAVHGWAMWSLERLVGVGSAR